MNSDTAEIAEIFKVCPAAEWQQALSEGQFRGSPVDHRDGFIHFSTAQQLNETVRRHFSGQPDLMLLIVTVRGLGDRLRWEPSRNGQLFPHLYGPLPLSQIRLAVPLHLDEQDSVRYE